VVNFFKTGMFMRLSWGEAEKTVDQAVYLHYYTDTVDYFISGYDGEDIMYGKE
jgi:hypothetical protein